MGWLERRRLWLSNRFALNSWSKRHILQIRKCELTGCGHTAKQVARALIQYQQTSPTSVHYTYCYMQLTACSADDMSYRPLAMLHSFTKHRILRSVLGKEQKAPIQIFSQHRIICLAKTQLMIDTRHDTILPFNKGMTDKTSRCLVVFGRLRNRQPQLQQRLLQI